MIVKLMRCTLSNFFWAYYKGRISVLFCVCCFCLNYFCINDHHISVIKADYSLVSLFLWICNFWKNLNAINTNVMLFCARWLTVLTLSQKSSGFLGVIIVRLPIAGAIYAPELCGVIIKKKCWWYFVVRKLWTNGYSIVSAGRKQSSLKGVVTMCILAMTTYWSKVLTR